MLYFCISKIRKMEISVNGFEYKDICPKCGRKGSLYPYFMGKIRSCRCDPYLSGGCGKIVKGITETEAKKRGLKILPELIR
jgi:hypothetical protein